MSNPVRAVAGRIRRRVWPAPTPVEPPPPVPGPTFSDSFLPPAALAHTAWHEHYQGITANVAKFHVTGLIGPEDIAGKRVLDFGGSAGQMAVALLELGAASAMVVDLSLPTGIYEETLAAIPNLEGSSLLVEELASRSPQSFDLVVAHSVTEHVADLASVFAAIRTLMAPGGLLFIAHDNYYHASGAHDNFMLRVGPAGTYAYGGPRCWDTPEKCTTSDSWRREMREQAPWTWGDADEAALDPTNCDGCAFYRRTHPWSHLLCQDDFGAVFRDPGFTSGQPPSTLNKVTPFQLRQFLVEAGFTIELWRRSYVNNEPPPSLLEEPFFLSYQELKTENVFVRARSSGT